MGLDTSYYVELLAPDRGILERIKTILSGMPPRGSEYVSASGITSARVEVALERCPKGEIKFGPIVAAERSFSMMLDAWSWKTGVTLHDWGEPGLFQQLLKHFPTLEIQGYLSDDYGWGIVRHGERIDSHNPSRIPLPAFPVDGFPNPTVLEILNSAPDDRWRRFAGKHGKKPFVADWLGILAFKTGMHMVAHQHHNLTATALRRLLELQPEPLELWVATEKPYESEPLSLPHAVARFGRTADLAIVVDAGVPLNASGRWPWDEAFEGETFDHPLHAAVLSGRLNNARFLLKAGATLDAVGENGNTPLHYAARTGNIGLIRLLLRAGHRTDIPNSAGALPAAIAARSIRKLFKPFDSLRPTSKNPKPSTI